MNKEINYGINNAILHGDFYHANFHKKVHRWNLFSLFLDAEVIGSFMRTVSIIRQLCRYIHLHVSTFCWSFHFWWIFILLSTFTVFDNFKTWLKLDLFYFKENKVTLTHQLTQETWETWSQDWNPVTSLHR